MECRASPPFFSYARRLKRHSQKTQWEWRHFKLTVQTREGGVGGWKSKLHRSIVVLYGLFGLFMVLFYLQCISCTCTVIIFIFPVKFGSTCGPCPYFKWQKTWKLATSRGTRLNTTWSKISCKSESKSFLWGKTWFTNWWARGKKILEQLSRPRFFPCFEISRSFLCAKQVGKRAGNFQKPEKSWSWKLFCYLFSL